MRFSTVVALYAAGAAASLKPPVEEEKPTGKWGHGHGGKLTTSTVYATKTYTVSDCPDSVTKCPHDKTKVVTETVAVSTTVCPVEETETAKPTKESSNKPQPPKETSTPCPESETEGNHPKPTWTHSEKPEYPACPTTTVKTITSSYTTVLPTVICVTETVECPSAQPTYPVKPTGGFEGCKGANCSSPAKPTKPVVAGAGSVTGSVVFAAVAGIAAFAFA